MASIDRQHSQTDGLTISYYVNGSECPHCADLPTQCSIISDKQIELLLLLDDVMSFLQLSTTSHTHSESTTHTAKMLLHDGAIRSPKSPNLLKVSRT